MSIANITWEMPQNKTMINILKNGVTTHYTHHMDEFVRKASSYLQFKIGVAIHSYYFPFIVLIGIIGNVLSFLVMIEPRNRHISTCIYMASLSVSDTILIIYQGYSILDSTYI